MHLNSTDCIYLICTCAHTQTRGRAPWLLMLRRLEVSAKMKREGGELRVRVHVTISHWKKGTKSGENAREAARSTASARHVFREGKYSTAPSRTCWASSSAFGMMPCGVSVSSSIILEL